MVSYLVKSFTVHLGSSAEESWFYFTPSIVLHILGVICTLSFIWFDRVSCCCCACWRGQQQEVVVYDPDHPEASLVWRDGEVIDMSKQEEETGNAYTDTIMMIMK